MENNSTIVVVGVTAVVIVVSYLIYKQMGCNVSSSVGISAPDDKSSKTESKKDAAKDKYPAGKISIYFGSQTGTAEGFARTLMEEGKAAGFAAKTIDMEDFNAEVLENSTDKAIFLMATYGEGEPTDNAIAFTKWMKNAESTLSAETLSKLRFCVFGLGNKQYEHYNLMGKTTDKCLEQLGAVRMFEYGEGDDDATLEEDFDSWKAKLWPALTAAFHPDAAAVEEVSIRTRNGSFDSSKVKLEFKTVPAGAKSDEARTVNYANSTKVHPSTRHFFTAPRAKILVNRELRNQKKGAEVGSTRHIEINLKEAGLTYHTADNLAILPENTTSNVELLAKTQGYDLDYSFCVEPVRNADEESNFKAAFPTPCTVRDVLSMYLDIQGPVKQALLKHLMPYVSDAKQTAWLMDLLHKDNRASLKRLAEDDGKNLVDLLANELSSCKIPLADLLHIVPYIQPRYYTISSSSSCYPDIVHITVSITEYQLKSGRTFTGLTCGFLKDLLAGGEAKCRVFVRPSSFRLPTALSTPIVMIGPGTGLAPMRALLQERKYQQEHQKGKIVSKNVLFFGCKNRDVDYIYRDELEAYQKEGVLTSFHTAFSRDSSKKVYVQNLMAEPVNAADLLHMLLKEGAYVYVCGATAMGSDVMATFVKILQEQNNMTAAQATAFVKDLQEMGRYVQELWTA